MLYILVHITTLKHSLSIKESSFCWPFRFFFSSTLQESFTMPRSRSKPRVSRKTKPKSKPRSKRLHKGGAAYGSPRWLGLYTGRDAETRIAGMKGKGLSIKIPIPRFRSYTGRDAETRMAGMKGKGLSIRIPIPRFLQKSRSRRRSKTSSRSRGGRRY